MSGQTPDSPETTPASAETAPTRTGVDLAYGADSGLHTAEGGARLALFTNLRRPTVRLEAKVPDVLRLREGLSALYEVVASDFSYKPKDRSAWLAFQRNRQSGGGGDVARARREYFDWLARNDPTAFLLLDPLISVHPDQVAFEVFSKDEGSYARFSIDRSALEVQGEVVCGTTNIDFSQGLHAAVQRLRGYRGTTLSIGAELAGISSGGAQALEKRIQLPDSWLRGFLQVQSAATLPGTRFGIAPVDLYNALRHLRLNADRKDGGRGLRTELVPGEPARLVLEPWELVLRTHGPTYTGRRAEVVRTWGRRRLMMLRRFLPFAESVDVVLMGSGLPSFWVMRAGPCTFTLGLSGFNAANWSQAVTFDLLLPRASQAPAELEPVLGALTRLGVASASTLASHTGLPLPRVHAALQAACQQGVCMYDLAGEVYRLRPILGEAPDLNRLQYRNDRERVAWDLVGRGVVKVVTENRVLGEGLELVGKVTVDSERREYRPELMALDDGRVRKAQCTCAFHRQHGLKEGPCAHLLALRLQHARLEAERLANRDRDRGTITVETRTYVKRDDRGEDVVRIALDQQRLRVHWGRRGDRLRSQNMVFNSVPEARDAYFGRVEQLEAKGFLDATAGAS